MYTYILISSVYREISAAMSMPRVQALVYNFILKLKEPGLPRKMADCRPGIKTIKDEPRAT